VTDAGSRPGRHRCAPETFKLLQIICFRTQCLDRIEVHIYNKLFLNHPISISRPITTVYLYTDHVTYIRLIQQESKEYGASVAQRKMIFLI
jgi:hypothetical protein